MSAQHFQEFVGYLEGLQKDGRIQSFDSIFLHFHGGVLNGFFLIKGEPAILDALVESEEWENHMMRAAVHLQGSGMIRGACGELAHARMNAWTKIVPGQKTSGAEGQAFS
jgi:hypothetical protein